MFKYSCLGPSSDSLILFSLFETEEEMGQLSGQFWDLSTAEVHAVETILLNSLLTRELASEQGLSTQENPSGGACGLVYLQVCRYLRRTGWGVVVGLSCALLTLLKTSRFDLHLNKTTPWPFQRLQALQSHSVINSNLKSQQDEKSEEQLRQAQALQALKEEMEIQVSQCLMPFMLKPAKNYIVF